MSQDVVPCLKALQEAGSNGGHALRARTHALGAAQLRLGVLSFRQRQREALQHALWPPGRPGTFDPGLLLNACNHPHELEQSLAQLHPSCASMRHGLTQACSGHDWQVSVPSPLLHSLTICLPASCTEATSRGSLGIAAITSGLSAWAHAILILSVNLLCCLGRRLLRCKCDSRLLPRQCWSRRCRVHTSVCSGCCGDAHARYGLLTTASTRCCGTAPDTHCRQGTHVQGCSQGSCLRCWALAAVSPAPVPGPPARPSAWPAGLQLCWRPSDPPDGRSLCTGTGALFGAPHAIRPHPLRVSKSMLHCALALRVTLHRCGTVRFTKQQRFLEPSCQCRSSV